MAIPVQEHVRGIDDGGGGPSSGIVGDRCWAVRDEELGGIRGAKPFPELMRCRAQFVREPSDLDHYRLGQPSQADPRASSFVRCSPSTTTRHRPTFGGYPVSCVIRLARTASLPGTYFDAFPLLVLTTASLATVRARRPDAVIDVRRFRPNIVVETDPEITGPVEHDWKGRHLQVGSVKLELTWRCPRCSMITHAVDDGIP